MKICFAHDQKSSVDVQPDQPQAGENGGRAECASEKILRARGQRRALRQAEQAAEQDAEGVEKCAGHPLTQPLRSQSAKQENFAPGREAC